MVLTLIRRVAVVGLLATFALVACGDSEATQRKAFIEFLQTRIVDKPGLHVPQPTEEQTKSFGPYGTDYGIILAFNDGMDKNVSGRMQQVFQKGMMRSLSDLMTRRDDLSTASEGMRTLRAALDAELTRADAAHAALKQPDALKSVYDKAYEKAVTAPATAFKDGFPVIDGALQAAQNLGNFLDQHRDAIKINGSTIQTTDPKLNNELNNLIGALTRNGQAVFDAQRKLQATIRGS
ncbi:MAG: DUF3053 domain-containing protein [Hyphomicrobiales bacterium]|nr:DUF3053 domain-containing protein [Hyphomicrobiales bacterium]